MAETGSIERYVRVLQSSLYHPKLVGLTAAERGTWLVSLLIADINHPGPFHEAAVREKCPDATFERLLERELIEQTERPGWLRIHDLKQFHVAPSSTPAAAAERKRQQRDREREEAAMSQSVTGVTDVTAVTDVTTDETRRYETIKNVEKGLVGRSARDDKSAEGDRPSRPTNVRGFARPGA